MVLASVACGKHGKEYKIGVAQCSSDAWRWQTNDEIVREVMFDDDIKVEIRSADDLSSRQIEDIRYFIDNDFDLIIVNPTDADSVTAVVKEAYDRGIPVVTFDRRINGQSYTAHLEVDNEAIGAEAAAYALSLLPQGAAIIEIKGSPGMTPTLSRHNGFVNGLSDYPTMKIVASVNANWNPDTAAVRVDSLLRIYPDVDLIYAHSDVMAISAAARARELGYNNIKYLGIDGSTRVGIPAVTDSVLTATFLYPTYGYKLIRTAKSILSGDHYLREEKLPPVSAVDLRNADILLQQHEMLTEETGKIGKLKELLDESLSRQAMERTLVWAGIVILLLLIAVLGIIIKYYHASIKHRRALEDKTVQLQQEKDKQEELYRRLDTATQSKLAFYTNVSHDLRTPLTLIEEPVNRIARAGYLKDGDRSLIEICKKNVAILRRLIDQLLDFRKYENDKLTLNLSEVNISQLVKEWSGSFEEAMQQRDIKFTVDLQGCGDSTLAIDIEKIERVFFNLMSNAIKFTPRGGKIFLSCSIVAHTLTLVVEDTGRGIGKEDINKVFDRFFRAGADNPDGTGIGLALTKAFVELHGGTISVESEPGRGSRFTVSLPVVHTDNIAETAGHAINMKDIDTELPPVPVIEAVDIDSSKPVVLVIDDNSDMLAMIRGLLIDNYNVLTAVDGQQGLKLASKYTPDLIICDVMMPVMDGLQCCSLLKNEVSTSHIPVMLLTACSMDEDRARAYNSGADAYLSKPFNGDVLLARCSNLLENRRRIKDIYTNNNNSSTEKAVGATAAPAATVAEGTIDSDFYSRFLELLHREIYRSELSVDELAGKMGLGQSQFTRKIKALTNFTPVEIIRDVRVKLARKLLTTTDKTVSEIAYEVGFATPAYFSKCYKDAYGESPSDLRKRLRGS